MTQRVFDVENEKDMADLWDILLNWADKITKGEKKKYDVIWNTELNASYRCLIKIKWHDKKEITRPIQEATEADIGKMCRFSLSEKARCSLSIIEEHDMFGILTEINNNSEHTLYLKDRDIWFNHCRRLTKQEIEELC